VVNEIPHPANVRVHDDRWDPGAETGMHDHPGPALLVVIEGELIEETPGVNTHCVQDKCFGGEHAKSTM